MTFDTLYIYVMVAASSCMLITGLILAMVKAPADGRAAKFRVAKFTLTIAVLILGVLNLLQISYDSDGNVSYLGSCIALAVSYLQAMLFTMTLLVLIKPDEVTLRRNMIQLAIIIAIECLLLGAFFLLPQRVFLYVYAFCIAIYLFQLGFYVRWYLRCRRVFLSQIESYYEEDEIERSMWWLKLIFWASLTVGFLSLLMLINERVIDMCLTMSLALFYAVFAACFINYGLSAPIILPAIYQEKTVEVVENVEKKSTKKSETDEHRKLEAWIKKKGYLNNEQAVAEIAAQSGMTAEQFHLYFRDVMGEEFRTWRVRQRIEEAKQLMTDHPEYSITEIVKLSGFNDRSFFYQQFSRFAGVTVGDFRKDPSAYQQEKG